MVAHRLSIVAAGAVLVGLNLSALAQEQESKKARPAPLELGIRSLGEQEGYFIGLALEELSDSLKSQLNLEHGVVVAEVVPDSPASKSDLRRHDILLKVGDADVKSPHDILTAVNEGKDRELLLVGLRGGKELKVVVTPAKRSSQTRANSEAGDLVRRGPLGMAPPRGDLRDQLFLFHPGVMIGRGMMKFGELPDGVTLQIEKSGRNSAKITVKKGDQSWTVEDDHLADLPAELRGVVERFLAGGLPEHMALRFHAEPGAPGFGPVPNSREGQDVIKRAQEEAAKAQRNLQEQMRKWQFRPAVPPGSDDAQGLERKLDEVLGALKDLRREVDLLKAKGQ